MNYAQIRQFDIANGEGIRSTLFVTGCTHNCASCFNESYQNFKFGKPFTHMESAQLISYLKNPLVEGLTLLGGEPFQNTDGLIPFLIEVKKEIPDKTIWAYSGYTWEEIISDPARLQMVLLCDVLIDGRFVMELRDLMLRFRGSSNQRIIDVKKSYETGQVVLYMDA